MQLRLGIVGLGNIGRLHVANVVEGRVARARVAALCSRSPVGDPPEGAVHFTDYRELLEADVCDAVVIATPTMDHGPMATAALRAGVHVLVEKPLARSVREAQTMIEAAGTSTVFGVILNQRLDGAFSAIRRVIRDGVLGDLQRVSWTMTRWYRPDVYFRVSEWRGTWRGEGGGALLNQCIHNIDVLQWLVGVPDAVTAQCAFGKYHDIEVEDEVTAMLEFGSAAGTLVASTGEVPGINQLDIVGDLATLRYDGEEITLFANEPGAREHSRSTSEMFGSPVTTRSVVKSDPQVEQHATVLQNFVDAILDGKPFIAPAEEGLDSLAIANAILLSSWTGERVTLPLDADRYEAELQKRIDASELRTPERLDVVVDMNKSFR